MKKNEKTKSNDVENVEKIEKNRKSKNKNFDEKNKNFDEKEKKVYINCKIRSVASEMYSRKQYYS